MSEAAEHNHVSWPGTVHRRWMNADCEQGLVSVVLPTFNRGQLLCEAMNSVVQQTYRPLELLVIDDGSTDATQATVNRWRHEQGDNREFSVRLLSQPNRGAPAARNLGLIESRGEFIQFLDSDDLLLADKLRSQVDCLQTHPDFDFVWADCRLLQIKDCGRYLETLPAGPTRVDPVLVRGKATRRIPTNAVTGLFRRRLCVRMGPWDESLTSNQDWEYMTRIVQFQSDVCYLPNECYLARLHDQGRISDVKTRRAMAIAAKLRAAQHAEVYASRIPGGWLPPLPYRMRMRRRYFRILKSSFLAFEWSHVLDAVAGIQRHLRRSAS